MSNIQVGLELLIVGMIVVFSVLLLLMVITIIMSKLIKPSPQASMIQKEKAVVHNDTLVEEELAVVAAVIAPFVHSMGTCNLSIREVK